MSLGLELVIVLLILIGAGFVLLTLGHRREDRMRQLGLFPEEGRETDGDIDRLIQLGYKIEAIKLYRKLHPVDLREAKEAVEKRAREIGAAP